MEAIIWDFDGTILDTETPVYESWKALYAEHGVDLPIELYSKCVGSSYTNFDPVNYLEEKVGRTVDWETANERRRTRYRELFDKEDILPGVKDLLQQLRKEKIKTAIASSSPKEWVLPLLEKFELREYFDHVITVDDVSNPKPDPELFQVALKRLDADSSKAIVIEDSPNGCLAAAKAGIFCLFVPNRLTKQVNFKSYDWKLESLAQTSLEELKKKRREYQAAHITTAITPR